MSLERQLHQLFRTEKITSKYGLFLEDILKNVFGI